MDLKDLKRTGECDKKQLLQFRRANRLRLLFKFYKLLYAAYTQLGEDKLEELLQHAGHIKRTTSSRYELMRVSQHTGYSVEALQLKTRKREIVEARQVAMYLAKKNSKESLAQIGATIGKKDHATVLHACKTVENLKETSKQFRDKWSALII